VPGSTDGLLPPLIVICGATATGKTGLSLDLAERIPGAEIIGADSRQVYRGLDIGTATASAADRARVPHHGLDLVDPDQPFTAADFQRHARGALSGIAERGGVCLLVGGTGLYLRAVTRGLPLAETGRDPQIRRDLETRLEGEGLHALVAELRGRAPTIAGVTDLANPRRVVRALERAHVQGDHPPPEPRGYDGPQTWLGLQVDTALHDEWIADRVRRQFESGLLAEASALLVRYPPTLPAFSAVGYREAFAVLEGTLSVDQAIDRTILRTRQLARRQRTWFRAEPDVNWLGAGAETTQDALEHVRQRLALELR